MLCQTEGQEFLQRLIENQEIDWGVSGECGPTGKACCR